MPTSFIGLSSARRGGETLAYKCATANLREGAVVIHDTAAAGQQVKAPTGAGNTGIAGVITNHGTTAAGDNVDLQVTGVANVLLDAGQAVNVGDFVIISDTDGSVKALGTTDSAGIVGISLITKTAGSSNELIPVRLILGFTGDTVP